MYFDWKRQTSTDSTASSCGKHSWGMGDLWCLRFGMEVWKNAGEWWWEICSGSQIFPDLSGCTDVFPDVLRRVGNFLFHSKLQVPRFGPHSWRTLKERTGSFCTLKTYLTSGKKNLTFLTSKLFIWDLWGNLGGRCSPKTRYSPCPGPPKWEFIPVELFRRRKKTQMWNEWRSRGWGWVQFMPVWGEVEVQEIEETPWKRKS